MNRILIALALISCTSTKPRIAQRVLINDCAVPSAIPNDGADDRVAIQTALDSQHCAYLPAGVYDIDTPQSTLTYRRPVAMLKLIGARLSGDEGATLLHYRGDGQFADWNGMRLTGDAAGIDHVMIDTENTFNTNEQTHAIVVIGPATQPSIMHVRCRHPLNPDPTQHKGSCLQFVGYPDGRLITDVSVEENNFEADRSGVDIHGGVVRGRIINNRFGPIGNTDIDMEGGDEKSDVEIAYNVMTMSPGPHGSGAIQLQRCMRCRVHHNILLGRGIDVAQSDDVEIDHNLIDLTQLTGTPVVSFAYRGARDNAHHNVFIREASAGPGAVLRGVQHGSGAPDHLTVSDNVMQQFAAGNVIETSGVVGAYFERNVITSGPLTVSALMVTGGAGLGGLRTHDILFSNNSVSGPLARVIIISGSQLGAGSFTASGNSSTSVGIWCINVTSQGGIVGPFAISGNAWSPSPTCASLMSN